MSIFKWKRVDERICFEIDYRLSKCSLSRQDLIDMLKELDPDTRVISSNDLALLAHVL